MPATLTDRELLSAHLAGEAGAFDELLRRHAGMILATCRGLLGAGPDAEDAAQAVFILLFRKAGALAGEGDLGAWLHRSALFVARTARRDRATRTRHEKEVPPMRRTDAASPGDRSTRPHAAAGIDAHLDALPEHYRQALVLCYYEGLSQSQAAARLRLPESTVANRCARALERLRERLAGRERELTAGALLTLLAARAGESAAALPAGFISGVTAAVGGAAATATTASAIALADGALKAMFWAKLKLAALILGPVLAAGIGTAVAVGASSAQAGPPAAAADAPIVAELTPRAKELLQALRTEPSDANLVAAHRQVKAFAGLTDNELHAVVPLLLDMLADAAELPAAGIEMDGGGGQVRGRASQALAVIAGMSLGQYPAGGGMLPDPGNREELDKAAGDKLTAAWKAWWEKSRGKPRRDWLAARRAELERAAGNLADAANQVLLANTLIMMEGAGDGVAAADLLAVLKKAAPVLKPGPAIDATSNSDARLISDSVRIIGVLGDRKLVPELVELARKCNTPEIGSRTALLRMLALTLNSLTGQNVEAIDEATGTIKAGAFADWLK
ncbi:MAG TPA: RNA polymerase sigma factor [Planctomycetota bacterium]|nr:RNA polymerase sigma factor [Planctomycetota bacterium]